MSQIHALMEVVINRLEGSLMQLVVDPLTVGSEVYFLLKGITDNIFLKS